MSIVKPVALLTGGGVVAPWAAFALRTDSTDVASISDQSPPLYDGMVWLCWESWIRVRSLPADGANITMLPSKYGTSATRRAYRCNLNNTGGEYTFRFWVQDFHFTGHHRGWIHTPPLNEWAHYAIIVNCAAAVNDQLVLVIDGEDVGAPDYAYADHDLGDSPGIYNAVWGTTIGYTAGLSWGSDNDYSDLRTWSGATPQRTVAQIKANRGVELAGTEPGLVSNHKLNNSYLNAVAGAPTMNAGSTSFVAL